MRPCQCWVCSECSECSECINYKFLNYLRQTVTVLTHASSYHVHHLHNCLYLSCISCCTLPSSHSQHYQRLLSLLCYSNFCYSPRLLLLHSVCYVVFIFNFSVYRWLTGCSVGLSLRIITSLLIITQLGGKYLSFVNISHQTRSLVLGCLFLTFVFMPQQMILPTSVWSRVRFCSPPTNI